MALRLGIGDTLTLCKGTIDLCSKGLHDKPEDAKTMVADMCLMRSHLQYLSTQMGDEKAFVASRPDIAPAIQRSLAPIHKDLTEMKQMLYERSCKRKPSLHIVDQVRYHMLYKSKLDSFKEKMPAHRKSISEMGTLVDAQTHSERRESIAKLDSLTEEHEEARRRAEEAVEGQRELLEIFGERSDRGDSLNTDEVLKGLEMDLASKAGDKEHMKHLREVIKLHFNEEGQLTAHGPEQLQLERFKF